MGSDIRITRVTPGDWGDFEALFEARGSPKNCWCMVWRPTQTSKAKMGKSERKAAMQQCVLSGNPVGLLAYVHDEPIAWCSVGPRELFRKLGGSEVCGDEQEVWSLTCFFVKRPFRRGGLSDRMIDSTIDYARESGAKYLEAYPVDPDSPSYRFMGFVPQFQKHGFESVGRAGTRRHVYRLALTDT